MDGSGNSRNILLVIHTPPPFGGGEIQAQNLKDYFSPKTGYIIYDYSRKDHSRAKWNKLDFRSISHGFVWIIKVTYLIIHYKPEVVYFTLPKSFLAFLRNMSIIPVLKLTGSRLYGELPGTSFLFLEKKSTFQYVIGLFFLKKIDEIRFLSPGIAQMHSNFGLKKIIVIENGVRIPSGFSVAKKIFFSDTLQLLYVGAIEKSKGIFNSLNAVKLCHDSGVKVHFNIVGEWTSEKEKADAMAFICSSNIEVCITFHGSRKGDEKWSVFRNCAILIHPTFWDGVPLTILEAMGLGLAVISTATGGIPDTVTNNVNGIILKDNTPELLFNSILDLHGNREKLVSFSEANKLKFEKKYKADIFIRNMEDWFEKEQSCK